MSDVPNIHGTHQHCRPKCGFQIMIKKYIPYTRGPYSKSPAYVHSWYSIFTITFCFSSWQIIIVVAQWRSGAVAQWRSGAVAQWRSGAVAQWRSGAVAQWRSGAVAQWRSGAVAQWRSGAVAITSNSRLRNPMFESCAAVSILGQFISLYIASVYSTM